MPRNYLQEKNIRYRYKRVSILRKFKTLNLDFGRLALLKLLGCGLVYERRSYLSASNILVQYFNIQRQRREELLQGKLCSFIQHTKTIDDIFWLAAREDTIMLRGIEQLYQILFGESRKIPVDITTRKQQIVKLNKYGDASHFDISVEGK